MQKRSKTILHQRDQVEVSRDLALKILTYFVALFKFSVKLDFKLSFLYNLGTYLRCLEHRKHEHEIVNTGNLKYYFFVVVLYSDI